MISAEEDETDNSGSMIITPVKTGILLPPKGGMWDFLSQNVQVLRENSVVCVASKIVSIGEGRCIPIKSVNSKDELIISEAERYLPRDFVPGRWVMHTISNGLFMPSSGIDESNANGYYILWPKDPYKSARKIWSFLRKKFRLKNLGVVICDSHSLPMRRGLLGISIAHWGFKPLRDYRGARDLFGRKLNISQTNIPDSLVAAAVFVMGEGSEQTPIAIIEGTDVQFTKRKVTSKKPYSSFEVPLKEDFYKPFLEGVPWRRGGKRS